MQERNAQREKSINPFDASPNSPSHRLERARSSWHMDGFFARTRAACAYILSSAISMIIQAACTTKRENLRDVSGHRRYVTCDAVLQQMNMAARVPIASESLVPDAGRMGAM